MRVLHYTAADEGPITAHNIWGFSWEPALAADTVRVDQRSDGSPIWRATGFEGYDGSDGAGTLATKDVMFPRPVSATEGFVLTTFGGGNLLVYVE